MNWRDVYTKIFLKELGETVNDQNVAQHMPLWWMNYRKQTAGGLRLTDEGFELIEQIGLTVHTIPYPKEMKMTAQILVFLDNFIDCPYYLDKKAIVVTNERKAVELCLFAGDLRKYGLVKALKRQEKDPESG